MNRPGKMAAVGIFALAIAANAAPRYWVAGSASNWNDTANWSASSGGEGGESVPGSSDDAIFDGGGSGHCALDVTVNVLGLRLESGFAGTVIQTDKTVTIGSNGYYQTGGVFAGGSTNITIAYTSASVTNTLFTLIGGIFTNTSGTLSLYRDGNGTFTEFVFTNGNFYHNTGTLGFDSHNTDGGAANVRTVSLGKALTLKHLSFGRGNSYSGYGLWYAFDLTGAEVIVEGDFRFAPQYYVGIKSGAIKARGNVTVGDYHALGGSTVLTIEGTGVQTYASSGGTLPRLKVDKASGSFVPVNPSDTNMVLGVKRLELANGAFTAPAGRLDVGEADYNGLTLFSFTNGTYDANGGTLRFASYYGNGGGINPHTILLRKPLALKHLTYDGGNYYGSQNAYYTLDIADEGSLVVEGTFEMKYRDPTGGYGLLANGGTVEVKGSVGIGTLAKGGTSKVLLSGTNNQVITHAAGIPPQGTWTIDKAGGTVALASNLSLAGTSQDLVWTNGALDLSTNVLTVGRNVSIAAGATTLGLTVADATTAGRLTATGAVSGIGNARLFVTVLAQPDTMEGRTYMILSNNTALAESFVPESWPEGWRGRVDYSGTGDDRKSVKLVDIAKTSTGTIFAIW